MYFCIGPFIFVYLYCNIYYSVIPAGALQVAAAGDGATQGLQTLTMTNATTSSSAPTTGATIVQYAQGPDGQFFIPGVYRSVHLFT